MPSGTFRPCDNSPFAGHLRPSCGKALSPPRRQSLAYMNFGFSDAILGFVCVVFRVRSTLIFLLCLSERFYFYRRPNFSLIVSLWAMRVKCLLTHCDLLFSTEYGADRAITVRRRRAVGLGNFFDDEKLSDTVDRCALIPARPLSAAYRDIDRVFFKLVNA